MPITCKIFTPTEVIPEQTIFPPYPLVHGNKICEIKTGNENLDGFDGLWTRDFDLVLGISSADCANVFFQNSEQFGLIHAGWRGLCNGICEKMLKIFEPNFESTGVFENHTKVFVGPILPIFEIQKDFCYELILQKFGDTFFDEREGGVMFHFEEALRAILPMAEFDGRNTLMEKSLASWRRDKTQKRNFMVVGKQN